jgi:hypothetical protein
MTFDTIQTDPRLKYLLDSGENLMRLTDPEGVSGSCRVSWYAVSFEDSENEGKWSCRNVYQGGDSIILEGTYQGSDWLIENVYVSFSKDKKEAVKIKPSKTLSEAFGPLSELPVHLVRLLASKGRETAQNWQKIPFSFTQIIRLAKDALFWEVEGGDDRELTGRFKKVAVTFDRENGRTSAEISANCAMTKGNIRVGARADIFGLSEKKATFNKDLGLGHSVRGECHSKEKHTRASVKAAFDVYEALPVLYVKQQRTREGLGESFKRPK